MNSKDAGGDGVPRIRSHRPFQGLKFRGELRPSQADVVEIARRKLREGRRRLHIVAPPGSGKTVLGLYLWAECVKTPAVVLSPNSAIQMQWAARVDLFEGNGGDAGGLVSTDPKKPNVLTSLTYQSVTMPRRGGDDLLARAVDLWAEKLIEAAQVHSPREATLWINGLKQRNPQYYQQRLSSYTKKIRDADALEGESLSTLHASSRDTLDRLRQQKIGLIILDECHHLMGHWGRVLADAHDLLDAPVVVGLTATPPDRSGKHQTDIQRYDDFFGEVDYEVPVPAVVKDGFLAPYQDLAYFVRPTADELSYVANADDLLHELVEDLCRQREPEPGDPLHQPTTENTELDEPGDPHSNAADTEEDDTEEDNTEEGALNQFPPLSSGDPAGVANNIKAGNADNTDADEAHPQKTGEETPTAEEPAAEEPAEHLCAEALPDWLFRTLQDRRLPTGKVRSWSAFERRDTEFARTARLFLLRMGRELPEDTPLPDEDFDPGSPADISELTPVIDRYVRHRLRVSKDAGDHRLAEKAIARLRSLGVQITETGCQSCASPVGRVLAYSRSKTLALPIILGAEHKHLGDGLRAVIVADYEKTSAVTAEVNHLLDDEAGGAVAAFKALIRHPATDALDPVLVTGSSVLVDDDMASTFDAAARAWMQQNGYSAELRMGEEDGFHSISGRGGDWCPRVYVQMITDLFQQGVTRCLVGTRGLLGEGWDANRINVLIDLTTVTTSMTVNQLRGRSIRLDPRDPQKLANNWDVVCIAPEFSKGLDDYHRFIAKHKTLFGVTDDGAIEKGVGHVHAAFTELRPEGLEDSTEVLNADMLERIDDRPRVRDLWKIGHAYQAEPVRAVETMVETGVRNSGGKAFPAMGSPKDPWSAKSLALAIGTAVLEALRETGQLEFDRNIHAGERSGGYVRLFLEEATEEESRVFSGALREALGPLRKPRYVIPREAEVVTPTWLTRILPSVVGQFFERRQRRRVMLHAVPLSLSRNRDDVAIFEKHWNQHVSPGEAIYAYHGAGAGLIDQARQSGIAPRNQVHDKEIFISE